MDACVQLDNSSKAFASSCDVLALRNYFSILNKQKKMYFLVK